MKTLEELKRLEQVLKEVRLPRANSEWGGADVVITRRNLKKTDKTKNIGEKAESFYPDPRFVITPYSFELSWLFKSLRDAFYAQNLLDSQSKIEFFGRLANAANRFLKRSKKINAHNLCAAVLHEAFAIYEEIEEKGIFESLPVAFGGEIIDDYVDDALRSGFIGIENTLEFFKSRGVEVSDD